MDGLVIGLDLNDDYTQICCYDQEKAWTIPTVICRRKEEEVWLCGEEAYAATLLGEGVIVDKLVKMAVKSGTSTIGGTCYTGEMLLERFIEKLLEYPKKEFGDTRISQLTVTLPCVEVRLFDTLMYCADYLSIPRERVHVISHTEAFIYYVLSQKKDLWSNQVGLFELSGERLCYYEMKVQRGLKRNMVQAEAQEQEEAFNLDILDSPSGSRLADKIVTACGEKLLSKKLFSTVFLTGKGFERQDWAGGFMRLICNRRKVFAESCLFARGAAYKGEDYTQKETSYPYVFVCEGRLNADVALKVTRRGRESYLVVASCGDNWYESKSCQDLILDGQKEMEFIITPLDPKKRRTITVPLTGFPDRPERTTRVELKTAFSDERTMNLVISDKGFGELFPSSHAVVKQEVVI